MFSSLYLLFLTSIAMFLLTLVNSFIGANMTHVCNAIKDDFLVVEVRQRDHYVSFGYGPIYSRLNITANRKMKLFFKKIV